jgi:hypothetical protein
MQVAVLPAIGGGWAACACRVLQRVSIASSSFLRLAWNASAPSSFSQPYTSLALPAEAGFSGRA